MGFQQTFVELVSGSNFHDDTDALENSFGNLRPRLDMQALNCGKDLERWLFDFGDLANPRAADSAPQTPNRMTEWLLRYLQSPKHRVVTDYVVFHIIN